jgi:hypothetical protein
MLPSVDRLESVRTQTVQDDLTEYSVPLYLGEREVGEVAMQRALNGNLSFSAR